MTTSLERLNAKIEGYTQSLAAKITENDQTISTLSEQIQSLVNQVTELTSLLAASQHNYTSCIEQLGDRALRTDVESLNTAFSEKVAGVNETVTRIQEAVTQNTQEISDLKAQKNEVKEELPADDCDSSPNPTECYKTESKLKFFN